MPKRTRNYDSWLFEQLTNPHVAATYINAAIEDSPEMLQVALRNVAEARRMSKVAEEAGVNRESLYRALSREGNPTLSTLSAVLHAVGLRIAVVEEQSSANTTPPSPINTVIDANPVQIVSEAGQLETGHAAYNQVAAYMNLQEQQGVDIAIPPAYMLRELGSAMYQTQIQEAGA